MQMIFLFQYRLLRNRSSARGVPSGKLAYIGMTARSAAVCISVKMVLFHVSVEMGACCWHIKDSLYRMSLCKLSVHCFPADLISVMGYAAKCSCRILAGGGLM